MVRPIEEIREKLFQGEDNTILSDGETLYGQLLRAISYLSSHAFEALETIARIINRAYIFTAQRVLELTGNLFRPLGRGISFVAGHLRESLEKP